MNNCVLARGNHPLLGTHSCKATTITWCSKLDVTGEHRLLLCGHSKVKDKTMLKYSRDAFAGPLHALADIIGEVFQEDSLGQAASDDNLRKHWTRKKVALEQAASGQFGVARPGKV